jgi:hypothetical protein
MTTEVWRELLSLTPRFIAVPADSHNLSTVSTVFMLCDGKRLKPLPTMNMLDATAMNRGVNEKLHSPRCSVATTTNPT